MYEENRRIIQKILTELRSTGALSLESVEFLEVHWHELNLEEEEEVKEACIRAITEKIFSGPAPQRKEPPKKSASEKRYTLVIFEEGCSHDNLCEALKTCGVDERTAENMFAVLDSKGHVVINEGLPQEVVHSVKALLGVHDIITEIWEDSVSPYKLPKLGGRDGDDWKMPEAV